MTGRRNYTSQKSGESVSRQATHFTNRYQEMVYDTHLQKPVVLARGKYEWYPFVILNLGAYPTAYVCLPLEHKFFGKDYHVMNDTLDVHGGVTYSEKTVQSSTIKDRWWIGWDYAHYGSGDYYEPLEHIRTADEQSHKWGREEILDEVKTVIKQLQKV